MTLIFDGNDFKYELESVVKLFYPAKLFDFIFRGGNDGKSRLPDDDYCYISRVREKESSLLHVIVKSESKTSELSERISNGIQNYDGECEMALGRLLFSALKNVTGKSPEWGILTGVRPVKRVNSYISLGMSEEQIVQRLKSEFLCSEQKAHLAFKTAQSQTKALESLDKNSFSLYVSIPFCPSRCSYCSFVSQSVDSFSKLIPEYVQKLCEEIKYTAGITKSLGLKLDTVYFGGGTPTSLTAALLQMLMKQIEESFDTSSVREYTVEAGRADTITEEKLRTIKSCGADRISINPQTLNDSVLEAVGRKHTVKQFFESFELAKKIGFETVNTDLIAGLPTETVESFMSTIDKITDLNPENVTVHTISIKRAADLMRKSGSVIDNPAKEMVAYATQKLGALYKPYYLYRQKNMLKNLENIGWTVDGKASLYNIYIMEEVQTIIAVGAGGSTKLIKPDGSGLERIFNYKYPLEYLKHFDLMLEKKNEILNYLK